MLKLIAAFGINNLAFGAVAASGINNLSFGAVVSQMLYSPPPFFKE
jgi:hypothetical protein